ncbi:Sensory transduction protein regX3 [Rubripirellula amarantea]|uniref:Sensory transduction protein regX3 n=1 Tax=Rubripirellula amarantea TaxID=2527999 RepID=A0A5C5WJH8_9BACT|nr:response regulator [Rubripirellula amarantea]TWT50717.1 Sensory transduction protein regX3 [Rubripirellula amarantea]
MSQSKSVLIAEDNPGLARVLSFKFKSSGFNPIVCPDGQFAWEAFEQGGFSAVVSDQEMPRMSGVDLCRSIRNSGSLVPFFLVTGRQLELSSTGVAEELSINGIIGKPFSPANVIAAVNAALEDAIKA